MLLKIRIHGPEEKPAHSCKVMMAMTWQDMMVTDYSEKHNAWNCIDEDSEEEARLLAIGTENMIGWVYSDEIFWQIVNARREAGHEDK
jgi:hypothetical protein